MEISLGEILFLDTNILLTATEESRPHHRLAKELIASIHQRGIHLGYSGQIMREYLVAATRPPDANGLGMKPADALANADIFGQRLVFFEETETAANQLKQLIKKRQVKGTSIHDANVVATMLAHGISKLITENQEDFSSFSEIKVLRLTDLDGITTGSG